jgi:hypothetical protein
MNVWTSPADGGRCWGEQRGCPTSACDDTSAVPKWAPWCLVNDSTWWNPVQEEYGWRFCEPDPPPCARVWTSPEDGSACSVDHHYCPNMPCDTGGSPWCLVNDERWKNAALDDFGWRYCDPKTDTPVDFPTYGRNEVINVGSCANGLGPKTNIAVLPGELKLKCIRLCWPCITPPNQNGLPDRQTLTTI